MRADSASRGAASVLAALAVFLSFGCGARAPQPAVPRPDSARIDDIAPGVTYEYQWFASGPWAIHSVTIDPRVCGIRFRTVKARDRVIGRETTSAMARRAAVALQQDVFAAINADFFSFDPPGVSEGPQIAGDVLIKSEGTHREALEDRLVRLRPVVAFTRDRKTYLKHTRLRGSVRVRGSAVALGGFNVRPHGDSAFVFDSLFGNVTPADTGALELAVRAIGSTVHWTQRSGIVTRIDTSAAGIAIPGDGFVLSVRGSARANLQQLGAGDTVWWTASFDSLPANITEMVGGYPMLLVNGQVVHGQETGLRGAFSDRRHPRSAIGLDRAGRIRIVAVDGRQLPHSAGMSLDELASYLLTHGVRDAMNFDGGGSTTLIVKDRIANMPSDTAGERPVANALLVLGPRPGECSR